MRTTVTLDSDVEAYIREACHKRRRSFKRVINDALRTALKPSSEKPALLPPLSMGLLPGIDPRRLDELADELEVEALLVAEEKRAYQKKPSSK